MIEIGERRKARGERVYHIGRNGNRRRKIPIPDHPPPAGMGLWEFSIVVGALVVAVVALLLAAERVAWWVLG